jgi:hypothetical protein
LTPRSFGKGKVLALAVDTCRMAKKPDPPKPVTSIYKLASKAVRLGTVKAPDEAGAMEKAAEQFKTTAQFPID